ncbi:MAG: hypothetical protein LUH07_15935, partial [Lachnospiraceae bacterium]|nr:hypothetical protein [Lachnospiraceae bacterium]
MKKQKKLLAFVLACSMTLSPVSYLALAEEEFQTESVALEGEKEQEAESETDEETEAIAEETTEKAEESTIAEDAAQEGADENIDGADVKSDTEDSEAIEDTEVTGSEDSENEEELESQSVSGLMTASNDSTTEASDEEGYTATDSVSAVYGSGGSQEEGSSFSMFKIAASTAVIVGDEIQVTIWVSPTSKGTFTYDRIYIGN